MKHVAVYCGSALGASPAFATAGRQLGEHLAARGVGIVYGGSRLGIMGAVAEGALAAGGRVVGVIPSGLLNAEVAHERLTETIVVETMHERKSRMVGIADAFAILPGGIGTMDEFFEAWTWGHLGLHTRPIGLLNTEGYFDGLVGFLDHMLAQGFVGREAHARVIVERDPASLVERLRNERVVPGSRWKPPVRP